MEKLRFGIISTAKIGIEKVIPAMQQGVNTVVAAIASRNLDVAEQAAAQLGIAKAYGSYEALLADPEVDAVYNPLPNHMHVPWSIKALEAGKHVLCGKAHWPHIQRRPAASRRFRELPRPQGDGSFYVSPSSAMAASQVDRG